jgi:DNA-binding Lrp family transcriptional regulator
MPTPKIDAIDLQILKLLQQDGKMTNIALSKKIGLSPAPTLERVRKLESGGLIESYHAVLNASKLGASFMAIINIQLARQKSNSIKSFIRQIEGIDEITECLRVTGAFDFQLRCQVADIPDFEKLINERLSNIEEIGQMQSVIILKRVKNSRLLPIKYTLDRK